jgi:hypothetical protein
MMEGASNLTGNITNGDLWNSSIIARPTQTFGFCYQRQLNAISYMLLTDFSNFIFKDGIWNQPWRTHSDVELANVGFELLR